LVVPVRTSDCLAANPDHETGQQTYDSAFLKSIESAPASTGPELVPGERKAICSVAEAQPTWLRVDAVDVGELFFMRVRELFCFATEKSAVVVSKRS